MNYSNEIPAHIVIRDFWWTFVFPSINLFSLLTNSICIFIFLNKELKDQIYTFMLFYSINEVLYSLICTFVFLIRCGIYCGRLSDTGFYSKMYEYVMFFYLSSVLAIFNILIEIFISIKRYLTILNRKHQAINKISNKTILIMLAIFSAVYYSPILFTKSIKLMNVSDGASLNSTKQGYIVASSSFGETSIGKILIILLSAIRGIVGLVVLFIIDIFIIIKFRKLIKRKIIIKKLSVDSKFKIYSVMCLCCVEIIIFFF
jgi:hypothetical protein